MLTELDKQVRDKCHFVQMFLCVSCHGVFHWGKWKCSAMCLCVCEIEVI